MKIVDQLLDVPSIDPDDARRRKLLNILLMGMASLVLLGLSATIVANIAGLIDYNETTLLYQATLGTLVGIAIIFAINRYWSGWLASSLFLLLLTVALTFSDTPQEVARGRSLFLFAIPILMASVILRPWASFIMTGIVSVMIAAIEIFTLYAAPNVPAMLGFFAVALVAWLSSRSLENALADLRVINRELDQRVEERTRDLAQALSKNQAILQSIADGVIVFDNTGLSTVVNPAMVNILGKPHQEIAGRKLKTLIEDVNQDDQRVLCDLVKHSPPNCPSLKFEWGNKTLSASFAAVRDDVGKRTGTVVVFRDFTREAELERMKSIFISSVSHELRTPLNAILGYADMLKEAVYGPISDEQRQILERIMVNSKRQLSIVNDMLDQAQIEAGSLSIKVAPFAVKDLIDDVMSMMDVLAQTKGLELTSEIASDVPATLPGDRKRLHQILINLVGNAIKFTDEGSVQVRVYRPNTSQWAMQVSDTGCGITPDAQSYVFDPFWQADGSITREHAGSGLGLSIVKQLTALMGGAITLSSREGKGSTFTITLPLIPIQEEAQ